MAPPGYLSDRGAPDALHGNEKSATVLRMKSLRTKTARGGVAKLGAQVITLTLRVGSLMVLARILEPQDFGLVAMVTAVTGVLNMFRDFGLSTATVQRQSVSNAQVSMLFWINLLIGLTLSALVLASATVIAKFYDEPRLYSVSLALSATFVLNAVGIQHAAILQRAMRFTTLAAIEVASLFTSVAVGIGAAVAGFGYWSLVAMTLCSPLVYSVSVWIAAAWIPGLPQTKTGIGSLLHFGGMVTLNGLVVYIAYNLEKVLLGRYWGADALGLYGRAYQLVSIPADNLNAAAGDVVFSALSRVRDDPPRLKKYFLAGYSLVVAATLPVTIACALFANDLVMVLLGAKWSEAVEIFRLLAPTILVFALINPLGWLLFSLGLVGRSLRIALILAPLVMASYVAGLPYGPKGVAIGYSALMLLWVIPHLAWCVRGTIVSLRDIFEVIRSPLLSALIAGTLAAAVVYTTDNLPPFLRLLIGIGALTAIYIAVLFYVFKQKTFYVNLIRSLKSGR